MARQTRLALLVPPDRIRAVRDLPTVFQSREDFERSCRKANVPEPREGNQTVGFSEGTSKPAHVDADNPQWRKTIIHERLHQLSDPATERRLGQKLAEGITEDLAIKELGNAWNPDLPRSYSEERALAHRVRELCGDGPVDRAYLQGDVDELRSCLDRRLRDGSLDKLKNMADTSDSPEFSEDARD